MLKLLHNCIHLSSVQFSRSVMSDSLQPHEPQRARPPCPSPTPGVHSDSRPSRRWCHPAISSSVIPFSSCPQSLPASESIPMSQLFAWGGQSTGPHTLVKWCLKFSKPGFSNTWTMNFQLFKLVLDKAEEPEIKLPTSAGSSKKQESSRKTSISALLTMPKPLTVWITKHCGKFFKRWEYQTTWPASWETYMQIRKQQLEPDMEQQTGSK